MCSRVIIVEVGISLSKASCLPILRRLITARSNRRGITVTYTLRIILIKILIILLVTAFRSVRLAIPIIVRSMTATVTRM